jgi:hypothetical protein
MQSVAAACTIDWPAAATAGVALITAVGVVVREIRQLPVERRAPAAPAPADEDEDLEFDWPALDPVKPPGKIKRAAAELRR